MSDLDTQSGKSLSHVRLNNTDELSLHRCIYYVVLCAQEVLCEGHLVIKDT